MSLKEYHYSTLATLDQGRTPQEAAALYAAYLEDVEQAAEATAKKGHPLTENVRPDENEQLIREQFTASQLLKEQNERELRAQEEPLTEVVDTIESEALSPCIHEAQIELEEYEAQFELEEGTAKDFVDVCQGRLNAFRVRNNLDREVMETISMNEAVAKVFAMVLGDGILNIYIFSLGSPYGIVGGVFEALTFAAINCFGAFAVMLGVSKAGLRSNITILSLVVLLFLCLNIFIVLIRASAPGIEEAVFMYEGYKFDRFSPVLFLASCIMCMTAAYKGCQLDDLVPGYSEATQALADAKAALAELYKKDSAERKQLLAKALQRVRTVIADYRAAIHNYREEATKLNILYAQYRAAIFKLYDRVIHAISLYRKVNGDIRNRRINPQPAYMQGDPAELFHPDELFTGFTFIHTADTFEVLQKKVDTLCAQREHVEAAIYALYAKTPKKRRVSQQAGTHLTAFVPIENTKKRTLH